MQALHVDASPLNSKKIHEKHQLKEAYSDFWNNNIKFKKGWESPAIEYKEVQDLLDEAADISIRIRSSLDDKDNSFKLRMIDGSARELLWDKCNNRDPLNDPQQFVRDIVHATFKDANGYVEGLSEEKIDELIEQYYQSQLNPHSSALDHNLVHNLNSAWKTAQENVNSLFNLDILQLPPSDAPVYKVNHQALHSLLRDLERLSQKAIEIKKQQENPPMKVEEVAPSSISEESSKGPTIEEVAEPKEEEKQQQQQQQQQDTNNKEEEEEKPTEESEATVEEVPADKMEEDNAKEEEFVEQQQEEVPAEAVQVEDVTGPVEESVNTPEPMNTTPENPPTVEHPEDKAILKIKVVAEGVDNLKKDIKSLHEVADNLNIEQLEETPEGKKTVQALQKKCLLYSEQLLKDLMSLDEIVNTPEARPLRKQQVQVIQSLMEDVDNLNSRLKTFLQHFVEKEKEEEEKRKAEEAKRKEDEAQQKQEEVEEEEEPQQTTSPTQERVLNLWKNLKLKPRMEVKEAPDAYIINSFIPGMNRDDIEISLGNNKRTISIAGIREPSAEEQAQLRLAVQKRLKTGGGYFHPEEDMETMLLKAGAGRFGRFEETYELPRDADVDNVGASYERGILSVTIPKIRKQNRMWGRPNYGHPSAFMNDRDFWW